MKPLPQPQGEHLAPKTLYYWELLYLPSKRPILHPGRDLICLGQKFYNDATQETQWWGAPSHTEPQPHLLATVAWNNLNLSNCCLQIKDKMKKPAHVPVQT
jgi:hypothetical protein